MNSKLIFSDLLYKVIIVFFSLISMSIIVLNLVVDHGIDYAWKTNNVESNYILVFIGSIILIGAYVIYKILLREIINNLSEKKWNRLLLFWCIIIFILQIIFAYNIFFLTGWDAGALREVAIMTGNGQLLNMDHYTEYFDLYPNNVFLLCLFTVIYKIYNVLHICSFEFLLVVFSISSVNISMWFIVQSTEILTKNRNCAVYTAFVYMIYIAFSPWIIIPYSDTYVIFFTSIVFYLYLKKNSMNGYLGWFLIFTMSLVGYLIKPTCIFVLFAIIIIEVWKFLFIAKRDKIKKLIIIPVFLVAVAVFMIINFSAQKYVGYEKNPDKEFPMTHFIMMGMNKETKGVYNEDDVNLTKSVHGKRNKEKLHLVKIKQRLKEYGVGGYLKLLEQKMLTNYNDGTFAWAKEGNFYAVIREEQNKILSPVLRNYVYTFGKYNSIFTNIQQCIWMLILSLMLFSVFSNKGKKEEGIYVLMLTIMGITVFLLLFEARARYLFLYAPYFIILSAIGLQVIIKRINETKEIMKGIGQE